MIFRPELAKLILQSKKSQTRRRVGRGRCRYKPGRAYAVQAGRLTVGHLTVTDVREEFLPEISLKDARREGFVTRDEFFEHWREHHGSVEVMVWVISFRLGDCSDSPLFLAPTSGGFRGDYTNQAHRAMLDAGEALSPADLERYASTIRWRDDMARRELAHRARMQRRAA